MYKIMLGDSSLNILSCNYENKSILFELKNDLYQHSFEKNDKVLFCLDNNGAQLKYLFNVLEIKDKNIILQKIFEIDNGINLLEYDKYLYSLLKSNEVIELGKEEYNKIVTLFLNNILEIEEEYSSIFMMTLSNKEFVFNLIKILNSFGINKNNILKILENKEECKDKFSLEYSFFSDKKLIKSGQARYYKDKFNYNGNEYYVTNHLYNENKEKILNWIFSQILLPKQRIIYGAPGTGKSHELNIESKIFFNKNIERVTFYDGYTYGQFIGMYKPTMTKEGDISYKYVPGPFIKQLVKAYKDSSNKFCLIIEEINRAKADKVFGNIFQLLDRDEKGNSIYPISASEEQIQYLSEVLKDKMDILERIKDEGLYLPNNLYIWATMNSADDGVQPLDTAFKRRWKFNYISLNTNEGNFGNGETFIIGKYKEKTVLWNNFRVTLNDTLKLNITEDRLIAPFFISPNDFDEIDTNIKKIDKNILSEKVLMYIFDDLLRHYPKLREKIFNNNIKTFSDIYEKVTKNDNFLELIFNEEFLKQLILGSDETDGKE